MRAGGDSEGPGQRPEPEQWQRRFSPPENELPAGVDMTVLLGRSDEAAVGLTSVEAFSTGFRFRLAVRVRRLRPQLAFGGLHMLVNSPEQFGEAVALADRLLLGIDYPDGQRTSNLRDTRMRGPDAGDRLMLIHQEGGGQHLSADMTYWVTPLPPEGPVAVVMAWPGFGIPETRTVLDGAAIRQASSRIHTLWPPQPVEPPEPPPPPRPSAGWFAYPDQ